MLSNNYENEAINNGSIKVNQDRRLQVALLGCMILVIFILLHLTATTSMSRSQSVRTSSEQPCKTTEHIAVPNHQSENGSVRAIQNETRLLQITQNNFNLLYFQPPVDIVFMTMAKGGTSTTWHWLYPGVTGRSKWDVASCHNYVHEFRSHCWKPYASYLFELPVQQRWDLLSPSGHSSASNGTSTKRTLRIAIQRNPYERIISAFKSKFTCEHDRFGTDVPDRRGMVPMLRKHCGMAQPAPASGFASCMNITDFANALEQCRVRQDRDLSLFDRHLKPQQYFFDEIDYDMVIDVSDLSDVRVLKPIIDRIPEENRHHVEKGPRLRHSSGSEELNIPESAAKLIYSFALESVQGDTKYMAGAEPTKDRQL